MEKELQLQNAAIAFFDRDGRYETRYSEGLTFSDSFATGLMKQALASANPGTPLRIRRGDGKVVFGSVIDSWHYKALLVQLLSEDVAGVPTIPVPTRFPLWPWLSWSSAWGDFAQKNPR